jgi:hypothetical protein
MRWVTMKQTPLVLAGLLFATVGGPAAAQAGGTVYRCPGPPIEYTDQITAAEAKARGCRTIENAPITIVSPPKPRPQAGTAPSPAPNGSAASRPADSKVDTASQRARDSDARKILEAELQKEEAALATLQKDFNNGEPERRGDERNYQRYIDRVEEMKSAITRKQADVAAIRRELAKLPGSN